jgi:hypothetical protein
MIPSLAPGRIRTFATFGYAFAVVSDIPGVEDAAHELFDGWRVDVGPSEAVVVYELRAIDGERGELFRDGSRIQGGNGPGAMLTWVIADVSARSLRTVGDHVAVHAGVVARDGRAVMLPAPPDHGKTTTTIGLVRAGFDFLSDECAAIGLADGLVHPFVRPLLPAPDSMALFPGLRAALPPWVERFRNLNFLVPAPALRPGCVGSTSAVAFVVSTRFEEGSQTELLPVSRAEMLSLMLEQTFNLEVVGGRGVERLAGLLSGAACYRMTVGYLDAAVRLIEDLMGAGST